MKVKYYTVQEVATICQVSPLTVYRWIKAGKLPVQTMGTHYSKFILETDIPTFLRKKFSKLRG